MVTFNDLPTETRILILQHLSSVDLRTFLISQATCRTFHLLVQEILSRPQRLPRPSQAEQKQEEEGEKEKKTRVRVRIAWPIFRTPQTPVHPVLAHEFANLFSSAACFTAEERHGARFLSLNGDVGKAFRRLPWASKGRDLDVDGVDDLPLILRQRREAFDRPSASWRDISVTFARGPPITRLEIVKSYSSEYSRHDQVEHLLVDLSPSTSPCHSPTSSSSSVDSAGFLTMGLLYDLLLTHGAVGDSSAATFRRDTGAWDLLLGRRLRSYALLVEYECFIPDDEELVDLCPEAEGSAILYVRGGTTIEASRARDRARPFEVDQDDDEEFGVKWEPEMLGEWPRIRPADVP